MSTQYRDFAYCIRFLSIVAVQKAKNFLPSEFKAFHPGGKLGSLLANVTDIMFKGNMIPLISPQSNLKDAILEMTAKEMGCCGIQEENNGKLVGIITDGDLKRIAQKFTKFEDLELKKVMKKDPMTIDKNTLAATALSIMNSKKITSLCVHSGKKTKKTIGLIHMHDILRSNIN